MTHDGAPFIAIAEIGGVFVAFGALISVSRRSSVDLAQLGALRAVVTAGLTVVVAALIPVAVGSYGLHGRPLWFASGSAFLLLSWAVIGLSLRSASNRRLMAGLARDQPVSSLFFWVALELPIQVPLVLVVLGAYPDFDRALYVTALAFNLFEAAFVLAQFVYSQGARDSATDGADAPS